MGAEYAGRLGPLPERHAQILTQQVGPPLWARALQALWVEFSEHARAAMPLILGTTGPPATLYAEKRQPWLRPLLGKREMSPEIRAIFLQELGELLAAFGWEA